jgi:hypothetical protein
MRGAFITLGLFAVAYAVRHHAILRIAVKTLAGVVRSERGRDGCFRLQLLASLAARESHFLALGAQGTIAKVGATSVLTDQAGRCNR